MEARYCSKVAVLLYFRYSSTFSLLLLTAAILYVTKSLIDTTKVTGYVTEALLRNMNNKPSCCFVFRVANLTDFVIETEIMLMCR